MGESEKEVKKRSLSYPISDYILTFHEGSKNPVEISADLV